MDKEEKKYTLKELKKKLTEKEKNFCHEYVVDWNGARAARVAGYSLKHDRTIAAQNLAKLYIKQYIEYIKDDYEMLCGISKTKQLHELTKIAYSSISHLHDNWITLKEFESLTNEQKEAIESIETKIEEIGKNKKVKYVKLKLYPKIQALELINKMMGYNEPDKLDMSNKDGSMQKTINLKIDNKDIDLLL